MNEKHISMLSFPANDCRKSKGEAVLTEILMNLLMLSFIMFLGWYIGSEFLEFNSTYGFYVAAAHFVMLLCLVVCFAVFLIFCVPICHVYRKCDLNRIRSIYRCAGYFDLSCFASSSLAQFIGDKLEFEKSNSMERKRGGVLPNYIWLDMVDSAYSLNMCCRRDPLSAPILVVQRHRQRIKEEASFDLTPIFHRDGVSDVVVNEDLLEQLFDVLQERSYDRLVPALHELLDAND